MNRCSYAFLSVLFVLTACNGGKQGEPTVPAGINRQAAQTPSVGQPRIAVGFELYNKSCRVCHGNNGNGNGSRPGPSLQRSEYSYGKTREAVMESIRNGRPGGMPTYGKVFSQEQIEALADYVLTLK